MAHPTLIEVLDPRNEFLVKFTSLLLRKPLVGNYVIKELSSVTVLHYHKEVLLCFNYLYLLENDLDLPHKAE